MTLMDGASGGMQQEPLKTYDMKVEFQALIKILSTKSLECGDKESEMKLRFRADNDTLDMLNRLHVADDEVMIIIKENKE